MTTATDINLVDPDIYARSGAPHEQFAWLREHAPVFWHAEGGGPGWPGFWAVTRHADVTQVIRRPDIFSSVPRTAAFREWSEQAVERMRVMMINMDPPQHSRLRGFVNRGFTPRMIGRLQEHITDICDGLLGQVAQHREAEFVADIAAPLPTQVICELVGARPEDRERIFELSNRMVGFDDPEFSGVPGEQMHAVAEMFAYADELAQQRREQPRDDIVSRLLQPDGAGQALTSLEFNFFFLLLLVAGNETTRNAAAGGMLAFFENPEQWQRLVADPSLAPLAAEEVIRWVSPAVQVRRTALADTELAGQPIAAGDKVVAFLASANRDADVFTSPQEFDIGRDPNPHVGFGGGPHFCLGRHLAALELRVLLAALAQKTPGIRPSGEVSRLRSNFLNGIKRMPVLLTG
ncbi:MAG TPA: cytochrome P450 [Streptosporangiaceae bacterium]|nr:cytochrome P450 [Streptosporangiaceae bacterium]